MINEELSNRIKSILGHRYTPRIQAHLAQNEIHNIHGKPFSSGYIRQIVNGIKEDLRIEEAIIILCEATNNHYIKVNNLKKSLLHNT